MIEDNKREVKGFLAAPVTPFDENGELNLAIIDDYAEFLHNEGVQGVYVCGATGEGLSLTVEERKAVAEKWMQAGKGKLEHIIIHVGTANLKETKVLAKHAESIGAHAIGLLPTLFPRPSTIDGLVEYVRQVSLVVPSTPIFYYHLPEATNVKFLMEDFLNAASEKIPSLAGIKFSSPDLADFVRCASLKGGKFQMLYGRDEQYLGAFAMGAKGAVGSTYNYIGRVYNRMVAAFNRGDLETARKEQGRSQAVVRLLCKYGGHNGVQKYLLKLRGLDVGPPRLPVMPLGDTELAAMRKDLEEIGFFDWTK